MTALHSEIHLDESDPVAEWAEEDRARADHYALLAQIFYVPPDSLLLAALATTSASLGAGEGPLAQAWRALAKAAGEADAAAVEEEYERLFIGIGKPEVMLYGSFHLAGFLNEEPLVELRSHLAELGLARREGVGESEDHLAALCEVMRHLIVTGPDEAGLVRQCEFFTRHLQPWYGALCASLAAATGAAFYTHAGALAKAFFDIETEGFSFDSFDSLE